MHSALVAILRGITPAEAVPVGRAVLAAGITMIEVPLNSPDPFASIKALVTELGHEAVVGAGTVLSAGEVERLAATGARLVVSPNTDTEVISRTKELGLLSYPGVYTASECFAALKAGADALKLFPAGSAGPDHLAALRAVLPGAVPVLAVGGVGPQAFRAWKSAGAQGFGIGSALYRPGRTAAETGKRADEIVAAFEAAGFAHSRQGQPTSGRK